MHRFFQKLTTGKNDISFDFQSISISITSGFAMKALLSILILSSCFLIINARQPYPFRHHQMKALKPKIGLFKTIKSDLMAFFNKIKSLFYSARKVKKNFNQKFISHMLRTIRHHRKKYKN